MINGLEKVPCLICQSDRERLRHFRPYKGALEPAQFAATTDEFSGYGRVVECLQCGLVFTNPRPTAGELFSAYGESVDEAFLGESSARSINAHLSLNVIKRFAAKGRLLEVGCSIGYFLNAARVDFNVVGIDPSKWACAIAKERFGLEAHIGGVESLDRFEAGSMDVVALVDVIEHLPDPRSAIQAARRLLKTGGLLYIVTPNIDSLSARLLRGFWWGLRPAHIYYFGPKTLARLLTESHFDVKLIKSFGRVFSYGYWLSRLRHYPGWVFRMIQWAIGLFGVEDKLLYIDTRDSMELCAIKAS